MALYGKDKNHMPLLIYGEWDKKIYLDNKKTEKIYFRIKKQKY